jgi:hypothetical protein
MSVEVKHRSGYISEGGRYLFTIDASHRDRNIPDLTFAEFAEEHKSHNCIILPNGQIGLYPNNRCRWKDESLTPKILKKPDFLVSTRHFTTETGQYNEYLGHTEEYFWEADQNTK